MHEDRSGCTTLAADLVAYGRRRRAQQPYPEQRNTARWGEAVDYGWSADKARHYAEPQRTEFGAFVRQRGFRLD
ncbi:hypothetical protein MKK63_13570 [Methylobacterium sp. J-088]|uniref:hypothetical protein n=1 Tax=unclassified Methylobacterium TaxID=2615210 RepID=UPI001FB918B0|nr:MULTISPECIES: hypothetical protein [unclassified Methylobacterium]MCJ2063731.1 hypothetical protein [Methylobacterium sp. J-088]